jgi:hypothetical protein
MIKRKKPCKECPWTKDSEYEVKSWQEYIKEKVETGKLSSTIHRCHCLTDKTFSDNLLEEPTDNICIGSLLYKKSLEKTI